ncbi:uncharacterized protein LOC134207537 [Armigeres subalbatus]|uniref:uncharacterized protein LOC134207537 n=1 Tax=Armigeres subalbatus TaxID=124917 RepID=UPI002ED348F7
MHLNDEIATSTQETCRLFAEKFSSVFNNETVSDNQATLAARNVPLVGQTLGTFDVDADAISKAASQLKSSNSPGPDGIPASFLKKNISCLLVPLHQRLFRSSLFSGAFASCWKHAHMFPVHKKGSKRDVNNYRGITSLSALSKLFELIIMEPLLSHCKQHLCSDQHGCTAGRYD